MTFNVCPAFDLPDLLCGFAHKALEVELVWVVPEAYGSVRSARSTSTVDYLIWSHP